MKCHFPFLSKGSWDIFDEKKKWSFQCQVSCTVFEWFGSLVDLMVAARCWDVDQLRSHRFSASKQILMLSGRSWVLGLSRMFKSFLLIGFDNSISLKRSLFFPGVTYLLSDPPRKKQLSFKHSVWQTMHVLKLSCIFGYKPVFWLCVNTDSFSDFFC